MISGKISRIVREKRMLKGRLKLLPGRGVMRRARASLFFRVEKGSKKDFPARAFVP